MHRFSKRGKQNRDASALSRQERVLSRGLVRGGLLSSSFRGIDQRHNNCGAKDVTATTLLNSNEFATFGPERFSEDLLIYIFSMLDVVSLINVSQVCKQFNLIERQGIVWQHLLQMFFSDASPTTIEDVDWDQPASSPLPNRRVSLYHKLFKPTLLPVPRANRLIAKRMSAAFSRHGSVAAVSSAKPLKSLSPKLKFAGKFLRRRLPEQLRDVVPKWGVCPVCENTLISKFERKRCPCVSVRTRLPLNVVTLDRARSGWQEAVEGKCFEELESALSTLFELTFKSVPLLEESRLRNADLLILDLANLADPLDLTEATLVHDMVDQGGTVIVNGDCCTNSKEVAAFLVGFGVEGVISKTAMKWDLGHFSKRFGNIVSRSKFHRAKESNVLDNAVRANMINHSSEVFPELSEELNHTGESGQAIIINDLAASVLGSNIHVEQGSLEVKARSITHGVFGRVRQFVNKNENTGLKITEAGLAAGGMTLTQEDHGNLVYFPSTNCNPNDHTSASNDSRRGQLLVCSSLDWLKNGSAGGTWSSNSCNQLLLLNLLSVTVANRKRTTKWFYD